jgi:hypothetical protein
MNPTWFLSKQTVLSLLLTNVWPILWIYQNQTRRIQCLGSFSCTCRRLRTTPLSSMTSFISNILKSTFYFMQRRHSIDPGQRHHPQGDEERRDRLASLLWVPLGGLKTLISFNRARLYLEASDVRNDVGDKKEQRRLTNKGLAVWYQWGSGWRELGMAGIEACKKIKCWH